MLKLCKKALTTVNAFTTILVVSVTGRAGMMNVRNIFSASLCLFYLNSYMKGRVYVLAEGVKQ